MANREQKNKDKANMKKKQEKKAAASSASKHSSASATSDLSASLSALIDTLDSKAQHSLVIFAQHLQELSITRISPSLFDTLPIALPAPSSSSSHSHSAHSASAPSVELSQLASIASKSSHSLLITPFNPQHLKHIEKAVTNLRLPGQPALTVTADSGAAPGEQRLVVGWSRGGAGEVAEEVRRSVSKRSEEAKSAVRAHRQAALTGLKKADGSEEERERAKHRLQAVVDEAVADIDRRVRDKEREIKEA